MAKRKLLVFVGVFLVVVLVAAPASASPVVGWEWGTTNLSHTSNAGSLSAGLAFNIIGAPFAVASLGFFDYQDNDLTESHAVGIWGPDGNLLTSATVVPGDPLEGHFRWHATSPVVLAVADGYRIATVTGTETYTWTPDGFLTDSRVVFVRSAYTYSGGLVYPPLADGNIGYFGPNMAGPVPVPSTVWLLGSGLLGLVGWRKKFRK